MTFGEYEVIGERSYRGHKPGTRFEARLDRFAERRAIERGNIRLLRLITPTVANQRMEFPKGWLVEPSPVHHETTEGG